MSRRCQMGTEVVVGNMYRLRVRVDVPGTGRIQKSFPICPVSGPGSLNKTERRRKRLEIVAQYNSLDYLKKVVAEETGTTFKAQSIRWMSNCKLRKRRPIKPVTLVNWQGYLDNHILSVLGSQSIAEVNNASMKKLVEVLVGKGLTPKSINNICLVVKLVKASAVDENGDELYSMKWNPEFIDAPVVDTRKQHTPSLTGAEITKIVASAEGWFQTFCILDAATGFAPVNFSVLKSGTLMAVASKSSSPCGEAMHRHQRRRTPIAPLTSTRTWRSCSPASSGTARADTSSARARESRTVRATSCGANCTRF